MTEIVKTPEEWVAIAQAQKEETLRVVAEYQAKQEAKTHADQVELQAKVEIRLNAFIERIFARMPEGATEGQKRSTAQIIAESYLEGFNCAILLKAVEYGLPGVSVSQPGQASRGMSVAPEQIPIARNGYAGHLTEWTRT